MYMLRPPTSRGIPALGCAESLARERRHLLDRVEDRLWSYGAVQADHVGAVAVERARDVFGRRTVWREAIHANGHLRHDGHRRIHLARSGDGLTDLVEVAEGLEDE